MGKHARLASASACNHEQRRGAVRFAGAVFRGRALRLVETGVEIGARDLANRGMRHKSPKSCFPICSQGPALDPRRLFPAYREAESPI